MFQDEMTTTPTDRKLKWPIGFREWLLAIDIAVFITSLFGAALSNFEFLGIAIAVSGFVMLAMTPVCESYDNNSTTKRSPSILYGLISFLPLIVFVALLVMLPRMLSSFGPTEADQEAAVLIFLIPFSIVSTFIVLPLEVLFIVRATKNTRIPVEWRVLWAIMLLPGGPILMPLYWFLFDRTRAQSLCSVNLAPEEQHVCSKRQ